MTALVFADSNQADLYHFVPQKDSLDFCYSLQKDIFMSKEIQVFLATGSSKKGWFLPVCYFGTLHIFSQTVPSNSVNCIAF